ncbi:POL4 protein, partial [Upupa epops]|nr:POL4 protein [Upupa epops]
LSVGSNCPRQPTGRIFLVDKNSRNTEDARLVVDFSQFSRGSNALSFPKYWAPNLQALSWILPMEMSRISLDMSQAFYHIHLHPLSSLRLAVSDGSRTFYFRKTPMGVGLRPFLLHILSTTLAAEIARRFNIWAFAYMDDFLLCHPSSHYLSAVSNSVCALFKELGIQINLDKSTPSPLHEVKFLGYKIDDTSIQIPDDQWEKNRQIIKKISPMKEYDWKVLQRFCGHLNFLLLFTRIHRLLLHPIYQAITQKRNFCFSKTYKLLLLKMLAQRHKVKIQPKQSWPLPRVATDATLDVGAVSHITGGWSHVNFSKQRHIHVQELLILLSSFLRQCCNKLVRPRSILCDSRFVCLKRFNTLPWLFALRAVLSLRRVCLYFVPSKCNPADGLTRGRHPDWSVVYYLHLGKPLKLPARLSSV